MTLAEKSGHLAWCALVALVLARPRDLFRLTFDLETAKDMHWNYRLLSDREWSGRYALALNAGVNSIHLSRASLDAVFDDNGRQISPLQVRLSVV